MDDIFDRPEDPRQQGYRSTGRQLLSQQKEGDRPRRGDDRLQRLDESDLITGDEDSDTNEAPIHEPGIVACLG